MTPILEIDNGPIRPVTRVRTKEKALSRVVDLVEERVQQSRPRRIAVLHADAEGEAWLIKKEAQDRLDPDELLVSELNPILSIHVGPGVFGLAFSTGA